MGRRKKNSDDISQDYPRSHARTPEEQESYMVSLAMDLAEERLRNGTASSAEVVHFLKLGSSRERIEQEDRRRDIELKSAKTEAIASSQRIEALYSDAVNAMRRYSGQVKPYEEN